MTISSSLKDKKILVAGVINLSKTPRARRLIELLLKVGTEVYTFFTCWQKLKYKTVKV